MATASSSDVYVVRSTETLADDGKAFELQWKAWLTNDGGIQWALPKVLEDLHSKTMGFSSKVFLKKTAKS